MVGALTSKVSVSSQTQASPPSWQAISETNRSRTGSPSALNIGARSAASGRASGSRVSGAQQSSLSSVKFVMALIGHTSNHDPTRLGPPRV